MKLHISVSGRAEGLRPQAFDYESGGDGALLTPVELERFVRLWLMAATDSAAVTQQVIDALVAKLKANTDGLSAAVDAVGPR